MSDDHSPNGRSRGPSRGSIRWLAVPIVLFWLAVAAITNALVPQLEVVGEAHNVALSSPDSPSLQAFKHIGKVFNEFDSDSAAMIVLEGDNPLGADAHRFYDTLVQRMSAGSQARPAHPGLLGRPADGGRLAEHRRQGRLCPGVSARQSRRGAVHRVRRRGPRHRERHAATARGQGLRHRRGAAGRRPIRSGQQRHLEGHRDNRRGDRDDAALRLPLAGHHASGACHRPHRIGRRPRNRRRSWRTPGSSACRRTRPICSRCWSSPPAPTTRSSSSAAITKARSAGQEREAAFYNMYRGTAHVIVGSGLTIAGAVFCLSFTRMPYFQSLGVPAAIGVLVALIAALTLAPAVLTIGSRFGLFEPKRRHADPGMAAHRHRDRPLARTDSGRVGRGGADRSARAARLQDQLRRRALPACQCPGQRRLRGRRTPLLEGPAQSRTADDRDRSRSAQSGRHDPVGAGGQGRLPHPRGRPGAVHHPAVGHPARPHLDTVSDQRAKRRPDQEPAATSRTAPTTCSSRSTRSTRRSTFCGSSTALQQQSAAATHEQVEAFHETVATVQDLRDKIANFDDFFRPLRNYFYWEPHCFDIPICCGAAIALRRARRRSTRSPTSWEMSPRVWTNWMRSSRKLLALIPPQIASQETNRDLIDDQLRHPVRDLRPDRGGAAERDRPGRRPSTPPRPTTPSTCRRRRSTTPNSSAA